MLFKVAAVSENTNDFGLYHHVFVARDGTACSGCANSLRRLKSGDSVELDGRTLTRALTGLGFELPRVLPSAPAGVVANVWGLEPPPRRATAARRKAKR